MKFSRDFDKSYLLLVFPILRLMLTILQYRLRVRATFPFILLWLYIQFSKRHPNVILFSSRKVLKKYLTLMVFAVGVYAFLPLLYRNFNTGDRLAFRPSNAIWAILEFWAMLLVAHLSLVTGKFRELKFCTLIFFLAVLWNGFAALRGGSFAAAYGGSARMLTALSQASEKSYEYYEAVGAIANYGMGGSGSVYISAFFIPVALASVRFVFGWKKWAFIGLAVLAYLNIQYGGLNTPVMITVVGLFLVILSWFKSRALILRAGILFALFMIWFSFNPKIFSFLAVPLRSIGYATESFPQMSVRCLSMADAMEGDKETYAAMRYELQKQSAVNFVKGNILVGRLFKRGSGGGGHSEFLDCLAAYGLLGGFVIALFWHAYLKYCSELASVSLGQNWLFLPYIYAGAWIFSSIPNPALMGSPAMVLIIPGLAMFYSDFERRWQIR